MHAYIMKSKNSQNESSSLFDIDYMKSKFNEIFHFEYIN